MTGKRNRIDFSQPILQSVDWPSDQRKARYAHMQGVEKESVATQTQDWSPPPDPSVRFGAFVTREPKTLPEET